MGLAQAALLLGVVLGLGARVAEGRYCASLPQLSLGGVALIDQHRGNVTVLSLVQANCPSCRKHVEQLDRLHQRLQKLGVKDLSMVGVNSRHQASRLMLSLLRQSVSFPILQDTHANSLWTTLGGHKDDVLVFDRCGRLTAHVTYPKSHVASQHVEAAIMWTYFGNPCGSVASCSQSVTSSQQEQALPSDDCSNITVHKCHRANDDQTRRCCQLLRRQHRGQGHHQPATSSSSAASTLCWCLPGEMQRTCACSCAGDATAGVKPTALMCTLPTAVTSKACECESGVRRLYEACRCDRHLLPAASCRCSVAPLSSSSPSPSLGTEREGAGPLASCRPAGVEASPSCVDHLVASCNTQLLAGCSEASTSLAACLTNRDKTAADCQEKAAAQTKCCRQNTCQTGASCLSSSG